MLLHTPTAPTGRPETAVTPVPDPAQLSGPGSLETAALQNESAGGGTSKPPRQWVGGDSVTPDPTHDPAPRSRALTCAVAAARGSRQERSGVPRTARRTPGPAHPRARPWH